MYKMFSSDVYRNKMILYIIEWLYMKKIRVFIFSNDTDSLYLLERLILQYIKSVNPDEIVKAKGGLSESEMINMYNNGKIIIITYAYGDTGISINDAYGAIWYHPRKSLIQQKNGRIFRINGDINVERYIFDIVDASTLYVRQLEYRMEDYENRELNIIKKYVRYDEVDSFNL
jgi:hypothetical protein